MSDTVVRLLGGGLFLGVGLTFLITGIVSIARASASRKWPTVVGSLGNADVEEQVGARNSYVYRPSAAYTYVVNGRIYMGSRIFFGDTVSWGFSLISERVVDRVLAHDPFTVYYDPKDPTSAVLFPGPRLQTIILVVLSTGFVALGTAELLGFLPARH